MQTAITNRMFPFKKGKCELAEHFIKTVKLSYLLCKNRKTGSQKDSVNHVGSHGKLLYSEFLMLSPGFIVHPEQRGHSGVTSLVIVSVFVLLWQSSMPKAIAILKK